MSVQIPVMRIKKHCDPFSKPIWCNEDGDGVIITRKDIANALSQHRFVAEPTKTDHAGRIAYLIKNEAKDPIVD